ncbi:MAG: 30S ribosomal protein S9 [Chthonomonas sp.]|nr:30S ribosomal protein S9 [Chthonomonas sp.]
MAADRFYGTGRRKCAVARVWVKAGEGKILINGRDCAEYLGRPVLEILVKSPIALLDIDGRYDITCLVKGGGISGQAGAIRLGISRALMEMDANLRPSLKRAGFVTRDARIKERKKYGRKKARRGFQFVKR